MKRIPFLYALSVATMMMSTGCFSTRFVYVTPAIPSACNTPCETSGAPTRTVDSRARIKQEIRVLNERDACVALHQGCQEQLTKQRKEAK